LRLGDIQCALKAGFGLTWFGEEPSSPSDQRTYSLAASRVARIRRHFFHLAVDKRECQNSPPPSENQGRFIMVAFRPLHDRVLIRRIEQEAKTAGGILIPDTAKEKPMEGEVLAVGPGSRDETGKLQPLDVKAGDRVLFGKWSGTEVTMGGEEFMVMKESDIMGVVETSGGGKRSR
jgi:chaperonin GroES